MKAIAINPKYQKKVDRIMLWNDKYDVLINSIDKADTMKEVDKIGAKAERAYDRMLDLIQDLPKAEQNQIYKLTH